MKKNKIFVADDNRDILDVITHILEYNGYEVEKSLSGKKLLELKDNFPDLILMDISMVDENGSEICKKLKHNAKTKHIPVLLISANKGLKQIASFCFADGFISKPFDIDALISKVEEYI